MTGEDEIAIIKNTNTNTYTNNKNTRKVKQDRAGTILPTAASSNFWAANKFTSFYTMPAQIQLNRVTIEYMLEYQLHPSQSSLKLSGKHKSVSGPIKDPSCVSFLSNNSVTYIFRAKLKSAIANLYCHTAGRWLPPIGHHVLFSYASSSTPHPCESVGHSFGLAQLGACELVSYASSSALNSVSGWVIVLDQHSFEACELVLISETPHFVTYSFLSTEEVHSSSCLFLSSTEGRSLRQSRLHQNFLQFTKVLYLYYSITHCTIMIHCNNTACTILLHTIVQFLKKSSR